MSESSVLLTQDNEVATVLMNRPDIHNAFNEEMLSGLKNAIKEINEDETIRVVILTGAGKSFSAGADINWMKKIKNFSFVENINDSDSMAEVFYGFYSLTCPTIAKVNGPVVGGGNGLVSVCDMAVASANATFQFSEVRLGIAPAVISSFLINKIGTSICKELFLTGRKFDAAEALRLGVVNRVVSEELLDDEVNKVVNDLLKGGPQAQKAIKELIDRVTFMTMRERRSYTVELISRLRVSQEAQDGMEAFFNKCKPSWIK